MDPIVEVAETLTDMASDSLAPAPYLAHVSKTGVDVKARTLYLGAIEEGTSEWVAQALVHLGSGPVSLYLNTPGGSLVERGMRVRLVIHSRADAQACSHSGTGDVDFDDAPL